MKILRISLKNLNSLRGDHTIDLEAEPLASAGIFAITGATGAGKSTLLDAITLALFGRSARYGTTPNPEDVMSRHTGECRAEVLFEIPSGRFTATWHLNRARGQPEGKLQPAKRFIYDAQGGTLAQNITQADQKIVELTGLDYDRFLRSVLLAQGEFARFLKARADERSELLEQLTGTIIYSQLGVLAHDEKSRREQDFALREQALGNLALLTEEERSARHDQITAHDSRLVTLSQERETLALAIQRGRSLADCLAKMAVLKARHEELHQLIAQHRPKFDALALHRRTGKFVADLARLDQQSEGLERLEEQVRLAENQCRAATDALIQTFDDAVLLADQLQAAKAAQIKQTNRDIAAAEAGATVLQEWLELHTADCELQSTLPALSSAITVLTHKRSEHAALVRMSGALNQQLATAQKAATEKQDATAMAQERLAALDQALQKAQEELMESLAGRTVADLELTQTEGRAQLQSLQELKALLVQRDEATAKAESLAREVAARQQPLEQIKSERNQLNTLVRQGSDLATALHESLRKSELIANLEQHRAQLSHGEACPLCGALDHPYGQDEVQPASEIARLKEELNAARNELQKSQLSLQGKDYELAKAEQSLAELHKQQETEHLTLQRLADAIATHPEELQSTESVLLSINGHQRRLQSLELTQKKVRGHEAATATAERAWLTQRHAVETAQLMEKSAADEVARLQQAQADNNESIKQATVAVQEAEQTASTPLALLGLQPPEDGAEAALAKMLAQRRDTAMAKEHTLQQTQSQLQQLATALERLHQEADALSAQAAEFQHGQQLARPVPLEDTKPRVTKQPPWQSLQQAQKALSEASTRLATAQATLREREQSVQEARSAAAETTASLTELLQASEFPSIEALRAARLPDQEAEDIARLEKRLTEEELQLVGHSQAAQNDAEGLRTFDPPQGDDLTSAEQSARELERETQQLTTACSLIKSELERDNETRTRQASMREQIEAERAQLTVWRQLADLIGSHDGKKFRVFAQGLSLDVLIRHANRHLQRLAERYRLRRRAGEALELDIVDLHQAGTTRPMTSLSGGESFLASLALALGLSDLAGCNVRIDSLFIDEGFGSLDADSLDVAIAALESLRLNQKTVGIISHVDLLKERITTQVQVERGAGGISTITVKA